MGKPIYLSAEEHDRISAAVGKAEQASAGEIVTIIADRSDGYTDVALAWAAAATLAALATIAAAPDFFLSLYDRLIGGWGHEWSARAILGLAAIVAVLKFSSVVLVQFWQPLKFLLIPGAIKTARVHDRAVRAFRIGAERRTRGRTGILIYLSMREHRAEIVADEAIATRVDPDVWGEAMEALIGELKQNRVADGMIAAIERVGAIVAAHLPPPSHDANELPDRLIEV